MYRNIMKPISNHQQAIAEQLVLNEIYNNHACYEAILQIKRWKFIVHKPGIAQRVTNEAHERINKNLLTYVSNEFVLTQQEYFQANCDN